MSKIPKLTKEAIEEAATKVFVQPDILGEFDEEKIVTHMQELNESLIETQPAVYDFLFEVSNNYMEKTNGILHVNTLVLYIMLITKALYIQEEINEVNKIFGDEENEL